MGHPPLSDLETLKTGTATAWRLAEEAVFPGEAELVKDMWDLTVEGRCFRIEFRLQQDMLGLDCDHDRAMVAMRFVPAGLVTPAFPWTLHVRGDWPERTDRLPRIGPLSARRLRKTLAPRRRQEQDLHRDTFMGEDVYVMPKIPLEDLTAQIVLFVWQTGLSNDPELFHWLEHYVEQTSRIRPQDRKDVARDVVLRLIRNKWWAEDARAWRKYLGVLRKVCARQYLLTGGVSTDLIDQDPTQYRVPPPPDRPPYDSSGALLTVEEASRQMRVSLSTLYSLIHKRRVAVEPRAGRMLITKSEVDRLAATTRLKTAIEAVATARGSSSATARKYVSRLLGRGYSLDEIAGKFAAPAPDSRRQ